MEEVVRNLQQVQEKIDRARKGRAIRLIAVSKFMPPERMRLVYDAGIRDFGENYPQYLSEKWDQFPKVHWHMIGQMQSNKVKYILGRVALIQSVDRLSLAEEIEKRAIAREIVQPILLQVNIGREPQKGGVLPESLEELLEACADLSHVRVEGLMAIPPAAEDPEPYFAHMRTLFDRYSHADPRISMTTLSMGMSGDYEKAIAQGATMVRVGSAIFGPRPTK